MPVEQPAEARPIALQLQASLIAGRSAGAVDLPSIGPIPWSISVALIDFVLSIAWTPSENEARRRCVEMLEKQLECEEPLKGSCHDGLTIAGWILMDWPARLYWIAQALKSPPPEERLRRSQGLEPELRNRLSALFAKSPKRWRP
jgi:hypothetical protein